MEIGIQRNQTKATEKQNTMTLLWILSLIVLISGGISGHAVDDNGYEPFGDSLYRFEIHAGQNWEGARQACQADGGDLVSINSLYEMEYLVDAIQAALAGEGLPGEHEVWWVGARTTSSGEDTWVDGSALPNDSPLWYPGEPNSPNEKSVSLLIMHGHHGLNDMQHSASLRFICERPNLKEAQDATHELEHKGYFPYDGGYYNLEIHDGKSWDGARAACEADGADLASINSRQELEYLVERIKTALTEAGLPYDQETWWVGARTLTIGIVHTHIADMWVDGTELPSNSPLWYPGEPNSSDERAVAILIMHGIHGLNDGRSDASLRYICEYREPATEATPIDAGGYDGDEYDYYM